MTRRLILAALALFAFLSLESCGVNRLAGPVAVEPTHTSRPSSGSRKFDGSRDGDNGEWTGGGIGAIPDMSDALRADRGAQTAARKPRRAPTALPRVIEPVRASLGPRAVFEREPDPLAERRVRVDRELHPPRRLGVAAVVLRELQERSRGRVVV